MPQTIIQGLISKDQVHKSIVFDSYSRCRRQIIFNVLVTDVLMFHYL